MITPHIPDKKSVYMITRSNYGILMEGGVKIYEYTPGFIHAKTFVSDDKYAVVSTINLDYRSLVHHYECGLWMYGTDTVQKVKADLLSTMAESHEVSCEEAKLNLPQELLKSILQIFTPLL
jgi:cardiolipin synthase